jgi:hypothetical protein
MSGAGIAAVSFKRTLRRKDSSAALLSGGMCNMAVLQSMLVHVAWCCDIACICGSQSGNAVVLPAAVLASDIWIAVLLSII